MAVSSNDMNKHLKLNKQNVIHISVLPNEIAYLMWKPEKLKWIFDQQVEKACISSFIWEEKSTSRTKKNQEMIHLNVQFDYKDCLTSFGVWTRAEDNVDENVFYGA